jgi:hypothetical protein
MASPRFFPDGDEAVVGLMAINSLERGEAPLFYWGQCYGFALLEAGGAALLFKVGGISGAMLKLAPLVIFAAGCVLFTLVARRILGERPALAAGVLLAAAPSWLAFSMKAWAGMVTAFALTPLVLLLSQGARGADPIRSMAGVAGAGVAAAMVFFAQPIAGIALLPLIAANEVRPRRLLQWGTLFAAALISIAVLRAAADCEHASWAPQIFGRSDLSTAIPRVAHGFKTMAGGSHFMQTELGAPLFAEISAALTCLGTFFLLMGGLHAVIRARSFPFESACAVSVAFVFIISLFMRPDAFMFRYLVPAVAPLIWGMVVIGARAARGGGVLRLVTTLWSLLWTISGLAAAVSMKDLSFSGWTEAQERAIAELPRALEEANARHACVTHPTLQWSLMFESRGRIVARWMDPRDRRPELSREVSRAIANGERVALVAMPREMPAIEKRLSEWNGSLIQKALVGNQLVMYTGLSREMWAELGFR